MTGRPSGFTAEIGAAICARLVEGETLTSICRDPAMPDRVTVWRWQEAHESFRNDYARAREAMGHTLADLAVEEATTKAGDPAAARLAFDARRWFAGKVAPRSYGDRVTQEHTGEGGGPVVTRVEYGWAEPVKPMGDA